MLSLFIHQSGSRGAALAALVLAALSAHAQPRTPPTPESIGNFGFEWATVGSPGNAAYEGFGVDNVLKGFGRVDYDYRMAKTEVTATQYLEFVNSYSPFAQDPVGHEFLGDLIFDFTDSQTGNITYRILPGWENTAMPMSWRMGARYVNWLHNGKANNRAAFESGVYDTSTFTAFIDPNTGKVVLNDQRTRNDGSKFWIPTIDEWMKAGHYDPNKNGPGQPGYWLFPTTSDTAPIYDLPENGGESSGTLREGLFLFDSGPIPEVGWYPDVTSPWGIYDMSGGWAEWLENMDGNERIVEGGWITQSAMGSFILDHIQGVITVSPIISDFITLRIASAVPVPGSFTIAVVAIGITTPLHRRRKSCEVNHVLRH